MLRRVLLMIIIKQIQNTHLLSFFLWLSNRRSRSSSTSTILTIRKTLLDTRWQVSISCRWSSRTYGSRSTRPCSLLPVPKWMSTNSTYICKYKTIEKNVALSSGSIDSSVPGRVDKLKTNRVPKISLEFPLNYLNLSIVVNRLQIGSNHFQQLAALLFEVFTRRNQSEQQQVYGTCV